MHLQGANNTVVGVPTSPSARPALVLVVTPLPPLLLWVTWEGKVGGNGAGPQSGKAAVPLVLPVWTCWSSAGIVGSVCYFLTGNQSYSFFSQKKRPRPQTGRTEGKPRVTDFCGLGTQFLPFLGSLFWFSFLCHHRDRSKPKWCKRTPHKVHFLRLFIL